MRIFGKGGKYRSNFINYGSMEPSYKEKKSGIGKRAIRAVAVVATLTAGIITAVIVTPLAAFAITVYSTGTSIWELYKDDYRDHTYGRSISFSELALSIGKHFPVFFIEVAVAMRNIFLDLTFLFTGYLIHVEPPTLKSKLIAHVCLLQCDMVDLCT